MLQHPTVTKGRFTIAKTGKSREFQFNPNDVKDNKQVNYGLTNIPGASHPTYQYGSGGERLFSFELYLDGDRSQHQKNWRSFNSLSVLEDIRWYQQLLYPQEYDTRDFVLTYPYVILFSLGSFADVVPCVLKAAPVTVSFWTPKMEPVRATLAIELAELVDQSKTALDVLTEL